MQTDVKENLILIFIVINKIKKITIFKSNNSKSDVPEKENIPFDIYC
jgi:hypothetical protein